MNIFQKRIEQANYLLFLVLLFIIPYSFHVTLWVGVLWGITWLLEGRWLHLPQLGKKEWRGLTLFIGLAIWMLWEAISTGWSIDPTGGWQQIGRHAGMLLMVLPAVFGLNKNYRPEQILHTLVISCVASVGVYVFMHYWLCNTAAVFDKGVDANANIDWWHMSDLLFNIKHRLHYASYITIGIVGTAMLSSTWKLRYGKVLGYVLTIGIITWLLLAIYWTGSRTVPINIFAIAAVAVIVHFRGKKRVIAVASAAALSILFFAGFLTFHPRFENQSLTDMLTTDEDATYPECEPRLLIWQSCFESPSDYSLYGLGAGSSDEYLLEKFAAHGWPYFVARKYCPHNQYINEWMELGLLGGILFTLLWLVYPWTQKKRARHAALYFTVALCLTMLTENSLNGVEGTFNVSISLLLIQIVGSQRVPRPSEALPREKGK